MKAIKKELSGLTFGRLTVIKDVGRTKGQKVIWNCLCSCGTSRNVISDHLINGHTQSCGCLLAEKRRTGSITHGRSRTKEHIAWAAAKGRCLNPKNKRYEYYGGRGIKMADEWVNDFPAFFRDMGPCPPGYTLERKQVDGDYSPSNCLWIPWSKQSVNRRTTRWITANGETRTFAQWAEYLGIHRRNLFKYLTHGRTIEYLIQKHRIKIAQN